MSEATNQCASSFGGVYDFYIERPWLAKLIGRTVWGVDLQPMYENLDAIGDLGDGEVLLDVPCGGGLALRSLNENQRLRFIALDIDQSMLRRTREKAAVRNLQQVEVVEGDMRQLPLESGTVDRVFSFSGLHMINDSELALAEFARVLKPGGSLVGSSFVADGSRRKRALFKASARSGIAQPPANAAAIVSMLQEAGFESTSASGTGFAHFSAIRP